MRPFPSPLPRTLKVRWFFNQNLKICRARLFGKSPLFINLHRSYWQSLDNRRQQISILHGFKRQVAIDLPGYWLLPVNCPWEILNLGQYTFRTYTPDLGPDFDQALNDGLFRSIRAANKWNMVKSY